jgi:hypothetical protein
MIRFHRTTYEIIGSGHVKARWWQLGNHIWGFRQTPLD